MRRHQSRLFDGPQDQLRRSHFDLISNLPANVALLQQAGQAAVNRLLIASSGGTVYGEPQSLAISKDHPTNPISPYGITKLTVDSYARMFHRMIDLPGLIARSANAYGEQQRTGVGQGFIAAAVDAIQNQKTVEIYGPEGTIRDYIHVRDIAKGIISALERGSVGETYNMGTGVGHTNLEILQHLKQEAERDGFQVSTANLPERRFDVKANILDSSKLQRHTGWQAYIDLKTGLATMWRHALNEFHSKKQ